MRGEDQVVVLLRKTQQFGAEELTVVEVERGLHGLARVRDDARIALRFVQRGQVDQRKFDRALVTDAQRAAVGAEVGAQDVVARDQAAQRLRKCVAIERATEIQRNRLVVSQRRVLAEAIGEPHFALRFGGRRHSRERAVRERVVIHRRFDSVRLVQRLVQHGCIHALTFMYFPGCSGLGTNHAGVPSGSRPSRAPGTTGLLASITVFGVAARRGSSSMS